MKIVKIIRKSDAKFTEGDVVRLNGDVSWTNYPSPTQTLKRGSVVKLQAWRPEGFQATVVKAAPGSTVSANDWCFVFNDDLAKARLV